MSGKIIEIKAEERVYEIDFWQLVKTIQKKQIFVGLLGKAIQLDDACAIRMNKSEWMMLTDDLCAAIIDADGDMAEVMEKTPEMRRRQEQEIQHQKELEAAQQQEDQAKALEEIDQLKAKCVSGEWSLDDLQSIFQLVSQIATTPQVFQRHDELSLAQNDLINDVCKNPSLSEPLKIMYSNAQLGMQQQILNNLEQLSSNQAQSNSILQQNQKSGNQKAAAGMLGGLVALNKLGDISDALGGDE